ncbi:MAG: hypothetical protein NVSMB5_02600 [Candidatus Velthaea sp.]
MFLCGPPACGKSTVGRALARELAVPFIDTDAVVVARAGMPIDEIFARFGEPAFRAFESSALADAAEGKRAVIALGGGTLVAEENRAVVARAGRLVYLHAGLATLERRIERQNVKRPLLVGAAVSTLLEARRALYEAAEFTVEVDGRSPVDIAKEIARRV